MQRYYSRVADTGYIFCRKMETWQSKATLTEHQPLKRCRQISRHLLIHPNLRFIIVPQPCRKRSVTLGDWPATHLSNFTLLSSHPFSGRLFASSRLGGNPCLFVFHCTPIALHAEEMVLCSFMHAGIHSLQRWQRLCRRCHYNRPHAVCVGDN